MADPRPALNWNPGAMAVDAAGAVYFSDTDISRGSIMCGCYLRKVQNGVITTVAATPGFNAIAIDPAGNIFFSGGTVIQEISNGAITTIAGTLSAPPRTASATMGPP